jgi:hypothetical protein
MSKLVELFESKTKYDRLNSIPGGTQNFSVRLQSDVDEVNKQKNATNFVDTANKFQQEFTVNEAKNSLAVDGISKAAGADYTKYTEGALSTYETRSVDPKLAQYGSKLIQKYLATKAETQFKTINEATSGIKLVYNPA